MQKAKRERRDNLKPEFEYQPPAAQQPVVNVYHANVAAASSHNQTALVIGFIVGVFGFWGVAHLMNGKVGSGILWLIFGPILAAIAITAVSMLTLGIGAILALPIWLLMVYAQAKSGATR